MSAFYDLASLVVVPSGYKASKVYAQKPLTTDGQLAFTRSTTATRVASNGLIEKVRTNLILRSEAFDNASWTKSGVGTFTSAITTGFTDPTGGTDAQRWLATIGSVSDRAFVRQLATLTNGIPYAISFWVKSNTGSSQDIYFMFQGGAVQATTATTSWQRISYSATTSTTSVLVGIEAKDLTTDILIYGFQLEVGDITTDYIATTTAAVSVGPVANVPRLDYLNSSCPRLLLEPQRTNLTTYSEQIDNAGWSKLSGAGGSTPIVTANYGLAPDGTMSAERVQLARTTTSFSYSEVKQNFGTSGTQYTVSVYLKSLSGTPTIAIANDGSTFNYLATLTNDWVRYTATFTASGTASAELILYQQVAATSLTADFLVWGFQAEAGAYATSYIPTLGASVTRVTDACSKTGISSLIGQTEGTIFFDVTLDSRASSTWFTVAPNLASGNVYIGIQIGATNLQAEVFDASSPQAVIPFNNSSTGRFKAALAYKANDFVFYVNGALVGTDTSGTVPACSALGLYNYAQTPSVKYNQALLFKTRLTNAQLAELTA
jgi:hypothetical protein